MPCNKLWKVEYEKIWLNSKGILKELAGEVDIITTLRDRDQVIFKFVMTQR